MTTEPTELPVVSADTDDLDAFTKLFVGKAVEPKEEVETTPPEKEPEEEDLAPEDAADDDTEEADDGDETPKEPEPEKKPSRAKDRINDLNTKFRASEREKEALAARLEALEAKQVSPPTPAAPAASNEPKPDAKNADGTDKYPLGEFDPKYITDLTKSIIAREQSASQARQQEENNTRQANEARTQIHNEWVGKLAPIQEKYEDFEDKTMQLEDAFSGLDAGYADYLANTIKAMDNGPEVLYYLSNHLDEAKKFVKLGPALATLQLGRYEAMFSKSEETKPAVKVSKAPVPPQVNKGSKATVQVQDDTDDLDAFSEKFFAKKR